MHNKQCVLQRVLLMFLLISLLAGCHGDAVETPQKKHFVDSKTKEVFLLDAETIAPAVHPETGKKTLMTGLYCSECKRWYPVPNVEILQRNPKAAFCPKHKTRLTPNDDSRTDGSDDE